MDVDRIIQEKCISPFKKSFITADGCMLPRKYEKIKNEIDNLLVNKDDIWICTFPKCGTTWAQEMIWLIANSLNYEGAKKLMELRFPFLEYTVLFELEDAARDNAELEIPEFVEDSVNFTKSQTSPRFIKTHFPIQLLPLQIRNGTKTPKIIYVARDPRDVCISFYHHSQLFDNFRVTFEEYCELFLADKVMWGPFWDHILPFWKMRHMKNILFLKYEDMKSDLKRVIRQVSEFLERPLTDNDVDKLNDHLSFASMKDNPAVNKDDPVGFAKLLQENKNDGKFMRKGVVGDYKVAMSPEMIKKFDDWTLRNTQGTDYVI